MSASRIRLLLLLPTFTCALSAQQGPAAEQLSTARQQIDDIDRQIVELVNRRAAIVDKIGAVKAAAGLPVTVPKREEQVLQRVGELGAAGPFPAVRIRAIYTELLKQMRTWEEERHPAAK